MEFTFLPNPNKRFQTFGPESWCHMSNSVFINLTDNQILDYQYCLEFELATDDNFYLLYVLFLLQ